ncbi:hypothetical protein HY251_21015 [bacterium]|nr:hypothetical protein [bacterium]
MRKTPLYAAVALVAGLAHAGALEGGYTFDDHVIVERNPLLVVRSSSDLVRLLGSSWWGQKSDRTGERLFRPLPLATFALERAITGAPSAALSRAVDVTFHVLVSVLVLALFLALLGEPRGALLGALAFAAHPLHSEAVSGVVGRCEVLALAFGVAALLVHLRSREKNARRLGAMALEGVLFFLALASKESGGAVILIAVAMDLLVRRTRPSGGSTAWLERWLAPYGPMLVSLVVYLSARLWALESLVPQESARTLGDMALPERARVAVVVLRDYWSCVLLPFGGTAAHHPFPDTSTFGTLTALLVQDVLVVGGCFLYRRGGERGRAVLLGLVAFELALVPVLNIVPIGVVFAERLAYGASAWAALALGAAVGPELAARKPLGWPLVATVAMLAGACVFSSSRNDRSWGDDRDLWQATVDRFPGEARARLGLGEILLEEGGREARDRARRTALLSESKKHLEAALDAWTDEQALKVKAYALYARAIRASVPHDSPEWPIAKAGADDAFARALFLKPDSYYVWLLRGQARMEDGEDREAVNDLARAHAIAPEQYDGARFLGLALWRMGDARAAVLVFTDAIRLASDPGEALFNRFEARWSLGERQEALEDYAHASRFLARNERLRATDYMIRWLVATGKKADAEAFIEALPAEHHRELDSYLQRTRANEPPR